MLLERRDRYQGDGSPREHPDTDTQAGPRTVTSASEGGPGTHLKAHTHQVTGRGLSSGEPRTAVASREGGVHARKQGVCGGWCLRQLLSERWGVESQTPVDRDSLGAHDPPPAPRRPSPVMSSHLP